jgi:hypothetical protein
MSKTIRDVQKFFYKLGGLHDADLLRVEWRLAERRLELEIDDLLSNTQETPEYRGPLPGTVILDEVVDVILQADPGRERSTVYDVVVNQTSTSASAGANMIALTFRIAPSGRLEVVCGAVSVGVSDLERLPPGAVELLS